MSISFIDTWDFGVGFFFCLFCWFFFFTFHNAFHRLSSVQLKLQVYKFSLIISCITGQGFKFPNNICSIRYSVHRLSESESWRIICSRSTTVRLCNKVYAVIFFYSMWRVFVHFSFVVSNRCQCLQRLFSFSSLCALELVQASVSSLKYKALWSSWKI